MALLPGMEGVSVPSRSYNILAAGKPILGLLSPQSEIALMIEEASVGWVVAPGAADELGIEDRQVPVVISAAGASHELTARSKEWGLIGFVPTLQVSMAHPVLEALQAGKTARVRFGEVDTEISLTGSRAAISALLQQCPGI